MARGRERLSLEGVKVGMLTVIRPQGVSARNGAVMWYCECACGNSCVASASKLNRGRQKSCGCRRGNTAPGVHVAEPMRIPPGIGQTEDLTGRVFGRWTVVAFARRARHQRHSQWTCLCECGTERVVDGGALRAGASKSCGCLNRELLRSRVRNMPRKIDREEAWRMREGGATFVEIAKKYGVTQQAVSFALKVLRHERETAMCD